MKKLSRFLLAVCFIAVAYLQAFADRPFVITGAIIDKLTEQPIYDAEVRLIDTATDSVLVSKKAISKWFDGEKEHKSPDFAIENVPRDKDLVLEVVCPKYETLLIPIDSKNLSRKKDVLFLDYIALTREPKALKEVTVTASKVKFYNRGDTIVYNADAFITAEGSMLDALIKQLPGVELKENGEIYVNGRYVESLMLNGKDFFKGNNKLMLENLAAYTVKNIEVYERQQEIDQIVGADFGKKLLTMDVKLKKEYNQGFMLNADAGYGTSDRYLGKLFAMWFADHARVSLVGNANNLNDVRKPGEQTSFAPEKMPTGTLKTYMGGVDYNVWSRLSGWSVKGNVLVEHKKFNDGQRQYTTNYLTTGDNYGTSFSNSRQKNFKIFTNHDIEIRKKKMFVSIHPKFSYDNDHSNSDLTEAVFNHDWEHVDASMIRDLFSGSYQEAASSLVNRQLRETRSNGHGLMANLWSNARVMLNDEVNGFTGFFSTTYDKRKNREFERFGINLNGNPEFAQVADRYIKNFPDHTFKIKGAAGWLSRLGNGANTDIYYEYYHEDINTTSDLFRLDQLYNGFGPGNIGLLPSMKEYIGTLDPSLSYNSHKANDTHKFSPNLYWFMENGTYIRLQFPVIIDRQLLDYHRGSTDAHLTRTKFRFGNVSAEISSTLNPKQFEETKKLVSGSFSYDLNTETPDLVNLVDIRDDRNPLNIKLGNPNLGNAAKHRIEARLTLQNQVKYTTQTYSILSNIYQNMFANAVNYNTTTGVRESKVMNINGNWDIHGKQTLYIYLNSAKTLWFDNTTDLFYVNSVDFMGENSAADKKRSVRNFGATENLTLGYKTSDLTANLFLNGTAHRYLSSMAGFSDFNAMNLNYGVNGTYKLPANFEISTDFTIYTRRGYSTPELNTDNFVWNARVSYTLPKPGLTFIVDGFDILNNLSNVTYRVNAQARTETYVNVLPRYVLFHIQWKFNKSPKKR